MFISPSVANAKTMIGTVPAAAGGTGASTLPGARANLQTTGPAARSAGVGNVLIDPAGRIPIHRGLARGLGLNWNNDGLNHNAFPMLCMTAEGRLIVAYRRGTNHANPNSGPGSYFVTRFLDDNGATISSVNPIYVDATGDVREPCIFRPRQGGGTRIFIGIMVTYATVFHRPFLAYSDDGGDTYSTPVGFYDQARWGDGGRQQFTSPPVELADGTLLWACYGWGTPAPNPLTYIASVYKSTDHGLTWTWLSTIEDGATLSRQPSEPWLALLDDNSVLAAVRYDDNVIRFFRSTNAGANWGDPASPYSSFNGCGRTAILQFSNPAGSPTNSTTVTPGAIVAVTRGNTPTYSGQQTIVYTSRDRAANWIGPITMDERIQPDYVYSGLLEVSPGVAACAYAVEYPSTGPNAEVDLIYLGDGQAFKSPTGGTAHTAITVNGKTVGATGGNWVQPPATTNGATLPQLEAELNTLKQFIGLTGFMPPSPLSLASGYGLWETENIPATVNDWQSAFGTNTTLVRNATVNDGSTLAMTTFGGTWALSGGNLFNQTPAGSNNVAWTGTKADYTLWCDVNSSNGSADIIFRLVDGSNYLLLSIAHGTPSLLKKCVAGTKTNLTGGGDPGGFAPVSGTWYTVGITLSGATISVKLYTQGAMGSGTLKASWSCTLSSGDQATFLTPTKFGCGALASQELFNNLQVVYGALADNDPVGYFPESSGLLAVPNGSPLNLTQATTSAKPTLAHITGFARERPWLLFNSGFRNMVSPAFTAKIQPNAFVGVFFLHTSVSNQFLLANAVDGTGNKQQLGIIFTNRFYISTTSDLDSTQVQSYPIGPAIVSGIFNGASSSIRVNGQTLITGNAGTSSLTQISLGYASLQPAFYTVGFAALHGSTVPTDVLLAERYFATKYGINLGV